MRGALTIYGVDVASYQGRPDWPSVHRAGIRFGFSKVTEGTGYINPTWGHNKAAMAGLGDGFLPGAYHFLHGGNGAAQARFFLQHTGDVSGLAVALDVEAFGADAATSRDWVAEFKRLTGGHPVLGYYPKWYWQAHGQPSLDFFDGLWQSAYVSGTGSAAGLYGKVPASWWASFGGESVELLQYSSSATVPGISGHCDVSAFRGSFDELRALALGEDDMDPSTQVTINPYYADQHQFSHDSYSAGFLWQGAVSETRKYGGAILAKLEAQQATIDKLVDAVAAGPGVDVQALKDEIKAAIESVVIHLDVPGEDPAQ